MRLLSQHWLQLLLFAGALLHCAEAQAQIPVAGYVVTVAGDTLLGAIRLRDDLTQQYRVEFIPLRSQQVLFLDAYELTSYTYYTKADTIRYVGLSFYQNNAPTALRGFLRQLVGGKVQLYQYSYRRLRLDYMPGAKLTFPKGTKYPLFAPLSRKGADFAAKEAEFNIPRFPHCLVVYQEDQPKLEEVSWWNLRKDAASYFADYPELATDLQAGRYRPRDIAQIVRRYNQWHATRQPAR